MNEAHVHPLGDQCRLALRDPAQQLEIAPRGRMLREVRIVAGDGVVRQLAQTVEFLAGRIELERAHAQMARCHPREHRAGQHGLAMDRFARPDDGEGARGGDAQGMHGLADEHLAQHRAERGLAVAAA